ncbi:MAG: hypothetical protein ACFFF9_16225 [Candidatus Thorarchaeota archaeon]
MSPQSELDFISSRLGVLLFSGQPRESLILSAFIWNPVLLIAFFLINAELGLLQWLVLTLLAGSGIQLLIFFLKMKRFRRPVTNAELLALFGEVKTDLDKDLGIELWSRNIDRYIVQSNANMLFKAILLSDSAIADILNLREEGKVVLAREVLTIEHSHTIREFATGLFIFIFCAFGTTFFTFDFILILPIELMALLTIAVVVGFALVLVLEPILTSRKDSYVRMIIRQVYGTSSESASLQVRVGYQIPDSSTRQEDTDEVEMRRRTHARAVIWSSIAALIGFAISFVAFITYFPDASSFILGPIVVSAMVGFFAFFGAFTSLSLFMKPLFISSVFKKPLVIQHPQRNVEWDISHPLADTVQEFLNKNEGYETVTVRAVRGAKSLSIEVFGFVVERLNSDQVEETIYAMMPQTVNDLQDVDLVGPLILSEMRRKDIKKRHDRWSVRSAIISVLVFAALFISILPSLAGFSDSAYLGILRVLGIFLLLTGPPLFFLTYWKKRAETNSDVKVAKAYPTLIEALQTLIDKYYTQPYGITSYKTRLERIKEHLHH